MSRTAGMVLGVSWMLAAGAARAAELADPKEWGVAPLLERASPREGLFRRGEYTPARVRFPAGPVGRAAVYKVGVRAAGPTDAAAPAGSGKGIEFLAAPEAARDGKLSAVLPIILYQPTDRFHLTLYDERDKILEEADVAAERPFRELPAGGRLRVVVSEAPGAVIGAMEAAGLHMPAGWETASLAPADLPENLAGLETADAVAIDALSYSRSSRRQVLLNAWALRHRDEAVTGPLGGSLLLVDARAASGPAGALFPWTRNPRLAVDSPVWVPAPVGFPSSEPLMRMPADMSAIAAASRANLPQLSELDRRVILLVTAGFIAGVALVGLFFAGEGRAGLGLAGAAVVSSAAAGAVLWQMPQLATTRMDMCEIVEARPTAPLSADPVPFRRVLGIAVAALRGDETIFSTVTKLDDPLQPAGGTDGLPARLRLQTLADGGTVAYLTPAVRTDRIETPGAGGAVSVRWDRGIPVSALFSRGADAERLPIALSLADARTFKLETGAGWPWALTDCAVIDVHEPLRSAWPSLAKHLDKGKLEGTDADKLALSDARVVPLADIAAGAGSRTFTLFDSKVRRFAEHVAIKPDDDLRTRLRKSLLSAVLDDDGRVRLDAPYLVGWTDLPEPPINSPGSRARTTNLGRLVFIRLDGAWGR